MATLPALQAEASIEQLKDKFVADKEAREKSKTAEAERVRAAKDKVR